MCRHPELSIFAALFVGSFLGCSTWSESTISELPRARIPYDSVVLEIAFIRVPAETKLDEVWRQIDEQHLSIETRRDLAANGIRSGLVGIQIPDALQTLLDSESEDQQFTASDSFGSASVTSLQQQITNRAGARSELVVVPELALGTVLLLSEDGKIRGEPFHNGQASLGIRTYPSGDGTVRLEITPEIKHGPVKQQWVPGNGTFLYDVGREQRVFDKLRFSTVLSPGQTLLVTSTTNPKGIGALFFAGQSAEAAEQLLLLIRLAQTQYDDLFAPEQTHEPLATPFD